MHDKMNEPPFTRDGFESRRVTVALEDCQAINASEYTPEVSCSFGRIEYIINTAFKYRLALKDVVGEIESLLEDIKYYGNIDMGNNMRDDFIDLLKKEGLKKQDEAKELK